jgi:hypothetical protein
MQNVILTSRVVRGTGITLNGATHHKFAAAGSSFTALARTHAQLACVAALRAAAENVLIVMFRAGHMSTIEQSNRIYKRAIMSRDGVLVFQVLEPRTVVNCGTRFV